MFFLFFSFFTVAPIGRKTEIPLKPRRETKKTHFSFPEKKEHLEDFTAEEGVRARKGKKKDPEVVGDVRGATSDRNWVDVGSTLGQRWVNPGSTLGNVPTHLGPILADFAGFAAEIPR